MCLAELEYIFEMVESVYIGIFGVWLIRILLFRLPFRKDDFIHAWSLFETVESVWNF